MSARLDGEADDTGRARVRPIAAAEPGREATLAVLRNTHPQTLNVRVGLRPLSEDGGFR